MILILLTALKSPGKAMLFSLIFPGGGQFYNEAYIKGIILGGAESFLFYLSYRENMLANKEPENRDYHLSMMRKYLFWGATVTVYSIADAWVDANMYGFDEETKIGRLNFILKPFAFGINIKW